MTLDQYLRTHRKSVAEFGREIGVTNRATMHKYNSGHRFPPPDVLVAIKRATGGQVSADDFALQHVQASSAAEAAA